ncbi:MAG: NAD-dependent protein deacylase [Rickettsiales bacterium]|nr:NAD-dependent protein deacylase [Rickettsiales bacterium]
MLVLSGAGLSAASGVPTFRDKDGLWEGHEVTDVATPEAWFRDPELVRRFYNERRIACQATEPNTGHRALAALQASLGNERVILVTQNIDGLLQKAGCLNVIEMHGSLWKLRCEASSEHPRIQFSGAQTGAESCTICAAAMRPDVVWFGEQPYFMASIAEAISRCGTFWSVGTSGLVYPAAGFVRQASAMGALCLEVNPNPSGGFFHRVVAENAETALPRLTKAWLDQS